mgnify:CR=1 FL=1
MDNRRFSIALFLLALLALIGGLAWLINLRFESGRAYALRSSLRSDPLGSKALHDAYAQLPGLKVERNFTPLVQLPALSPEAALLMLNTSGWQMHRLADFDRIVDFVEDGGQLIIALNPDQVAYAHLEDDTANPDDTDPDADSEETNEKPERSIHTRRSGEENEVFWAGLALQRGKHAGGEAERASATAANLPEQIPWRAGGILVEFDDAVWSPVYQIEEAVVAAQRAIGEGRVIVMTDDYLFSNEALLQHRYPQLLAWVLGDQRKLIFEETHLGVSERTGVATLMRRYGLEGFAIAFAGLMTLVVWRGASPLLPPFGGRARDAVIRSEHSLEAGLSDLIGRSVPTKSMPRLAFEAWKQSFVHTEAQRRFYAETLHEIETLLQAQEKLAPRHRKPAETHLKIKSIINRKKRRRP